MRTGIVGMELHTMESELVKRPERKVSGHSCAAKSSADLTFLLLSVDVRYLL